MTLLALALTITIAGDSHAAGHPGRALAGLLRSQGYDVRVQARVGARISNARIPETGIVILFLGSNDTPTAATLARYARLPANVLLIGPPASTNVRVLAMSMALAELQLPRFVDARACTRLVESTDGLHYGRKGAERWAMCNLPTVLTFVNGAVR